MRAVFGQKVVVVATLVGLLADGSGFTTIESYRCSSKQYEVDPKFSE